MAKTLKPAAQSARFAPAGPEKKCDQCGRLFRAPRVAPHKRFCSTECRNSFHIDERARALAFIRGETI